MALSTAEAEYNALAAAAQEAIWLRQLTTDLNNGPVGAMVILEDNHAGCNQHGQKPTVPWEKQTHCNQVPLHQGSRQQWECGILLY